MKNSSVTAASNQMIPIIALAAQAERRGDVRQGFRRDTRPGGIDGIVEHLDQGARPRHSRPRESWT